MIDGLNEVLDLVKQAKNSLISLNMKNDDDLFFKKYLLILYEIQISVKAKLNLIQETNDLYNLSAQNFENASFIYSK